MRISKSQLKKIISEEIQKESAILDRAMKRGLASTKGSSTSTATEEPAEQPEPAEEPEPEVEKPAASTPEIRTISFTKDIMPELAAEMPLQDRHKLGKLYKKMKNKRVTNKIISTRKRENLKQNLHDLRKNYQQQDEKFKEILKSIERKLSSVASQMGKFQTADKAKQIITTVAKDKEVNLDDKILRDLLNIVFEGGKDDVRIVESVIERIIFENLKGNKVIL